MLYNETFKDKLIKEMKIINSEKTLFLFDNEDGVKSMDFNLYKDFYNLPITDFFESYINENPDNYINIVAKFFIDKYYENWTNIKKALIVKYDLLWTGGNERTEKETYKDVIKTTTTSNNKMDVMAFNSPDYVPSQSASGNDNNDTNSDRSVERSIVNKSNSVSYTQAEVIEKELHLRINNTIFNIIKDDIRNELINSLY